MTTTRSVDVSIVIPTYNGLELLRPCLDALQESVRGMNAEVIVVDDGSTDGTPEFLAGLPWVTAIRSSTNQGFASACNRGLLLGTGRYLSILNNDTVVDPQWVPRSVAFLASHPDVGCCAPLIRYLKSPDVVNSAGIEVDWSGIPRERLSGSKVAGSDVEPVEVFGPSGTAFVARREMILDVGVFESRFGAYLEDVDWAWRARRRGWKTFHVPAAQLLHHHSATMKQGSWRKAFLLSRNRVWLVLRNASADQIVGGMPRSAVFDLGTVLFNAFVKRSAAPIVGKLAALRRPPPVMSVRTGSPMLPRAAFSPGRALSRQVADRLGRDRMASDPARHERVERPIGR